MSFSLKNLLAWIKSSSQQKTSPEQVIEQPVKIQPILEPNHLNAAAIISEEIDADEYAAAQQFFENNKAS